MDMYRTKNQEPRTKNQEPRAKNKEQRYSMIYISILQCIKSD